MSDDKVREMFDACTRRLDDYHFVQCMRTPRCTCHLAIVKDAILANFNAMHNAGIAAERELLKAEVEKSCGHCDYDEAEGGLLNHCPACCHRITSFVWELTHPSIRAGDA